MPHVRCALRACAVVVRSLAWVLPGAVLSLQQRLLPDMWGGNLLIGSNLRPA